MISTLSCCLLYLAGRVSGGRVTRANTRQLGLPSSPSLPAGQPRGQPRACRQGRDIGEAEGLYAGPAGHQLDQGALTQAWHAYHHPNPWLDNGGEGRGEQQAGRHYRRRDDGDRRHLSQVYAGRRPLSTGGSYEYLKSVSHYLRQSCTCILAEPFENRE